MAGSIMTPSEKKNIAISITKTIFTQKEHHFIFAV